MNSIDRPAGVRQGEELPVDRLTDYLRKALSDTSGTLETGQFPSGFSNLTYLINFGGREMVLRRPPFGKKAKSAHDMKREYLMLERLKPHFPLCPAPILLCTDESVMGCDFYLMERIQGIIMRRDLPKNMTLSKEDARQLCYNMVKVQADLHSVDYHKAGLADHGKPEGYVRRQIEGWSGRYRDARTPDVPDFEEVMGWLAKTMPADYPVPSVIHNDYKFDNVILNPDRPLEIIGVLDWEMSTIGDPFMDLGSSLAYWITANDPPEMQAIRQLATNIPGMMTREELVEEYCKIRGIKPVPFDFYYCFGLFRLAVIAQQIYYRFYNGQTKDERFKQLGMAVTLLEKVASRVIEKAI